MRKYATLTTDFFPARQGVEDDDMNVIRLGVRAIGDILIWERVCVFLNARFKKSQRFQPRLDEVAAFEREEMPW